MPCYVGSKDNKISHCQLFTEGNLGVGVVRGATMKFLRGGGEMS